MQGNYRRVTRKIKSVGVFLFLGSHFRCFHKLGPIVYTLHKCASYCLLSWPCPDSHSRLMAACIPKCIGDPSGRLARGARVLSRECRLSPTFSPSDSTTA